MKTGKVKVKGDFFTSLKNNFTTKKWVRPTFCISWGRRASCVDCAGRARCGSGWRPSAERTCASCTMDSCGRCPRGERCPGEAPARCTRADRVLPAGSRDAPAPRRTCWPSASWQSSRTEVRRHSLSSLNPFAGGSKIQE